MNPLGMFSSKLGSALRQRLGVTSLQKRLDTLERVVMESKEETIERAKMRWRNTKPSVALTWGRQLSGDSFIAKASSYGVFAKDRNIIEIGPGYGRLLKSVLQHKLPFGNYLGVDISPQNVQHLRAELAAPNINFVNADAEEFITNEQFHVLISSLTLKHIFPTFEKALNNISALLADDAMVVIDLVEGDASYFEEDGMTYIRAYQRPEVTQILAQSGIDVVAFDEVQHDNDYRRLLVVGKKSEANSINRLSAAGAHQAYAS